MAGRWRVVDPKIGERGTAKERVAAMYAARRRGERRRRVLRWSAMVVLVAMVAGGTTVAVLHASAAGHQVADATPARPGPEGISLETGALLAPEGTAATGQTVDGIQCGASEEVAYHIHSHLAVYVDGSPRAIPAGIGIVSPVAQPSSAGQFDSATRCYYWLHVHAQDGVIHVESPTVRTYTLGQFFAIWRQPLTAHRVGPDQGSVTAFVDGRRYTGDPAQIPLRAHEDIQLDVGSPAVGAQSVNWSASQL